MSPALMTPPDRRSAARVPSQQAGQYVAFGNVVARNDLQALFEVPLMARALRLPRGQRVLEVGCGRGIALPVLAERLSLVGLDIDADLVAAAEQHMGRTDTRARIVEGDIRALPFDTGSFDLVVDFGTCYHVSGGALGARLALAEITRVLAPGGLFVHETPAAQHLAHPVRSFGHTLPWESVPGLVRERTAILWSARRKRALPTFSPDFSRSTQGLRTVHP